MRIGRALLVTLGLGALAGSALAQGTATAPAAPPPAAPPPAQQPPAGQAPATATGQAPAGQPAPAGAPTAGDKAEADKKAPSQAGGYSWSDKPRGKKAKRRRATKRAARVMKVDPNAPLATYPGFRMLKQGKSAVWVYVSRKVKVDVRKARGRVTYVMSGAQVGIWNNTNPLVTDFFNTPLSRAWLRPEKGGAELVLELRENVEPKHRVVDGPRGAMILQVELPRPSRSYAASSPVKRQNAQQGRASGSRP